MARHTNKILIALIVSYILLCVCTFAGMWTCVEVLSPMTVGLIVVLLLSYIRNLGIFSFTSIFLAIGFGAWAVSDVIRFLNHHVFGVEPLSSLVRMIYLLPNYFFGISLGLWLVICLKDRRRDLSYLLVNVFSFTIIALVLMHKVLVTFSPYGSVDMGTQVRTMLYFFANFLIVIMAVHLLYMIGWENMFKETVLTTYGILGYIILDFRYNLLGAWGLEPENAYMDLIYVGFMIVTVLGTYFQVIRQYDFPLQEHDFSEEALHQRILMGIAAILFDLALFIAGWLTQTEALYIVITLLAFAIMSYMLRADLLSQKLIEQQRRQNVVLEEMVEKKTGELKEANEHLEVLSSVDMLTGLKNRRLAHEYVSGLADGRTDAGWAIFNIDLNRFKPVNDTYGHEMGDRVLREFGRRMLSLDEGFSAFRMGGDEFLVVLDGVKEKREVRKAASLLQELFRADVVIGSYVFKLSASIGVAIYPEDSDDPMELLGYADAAMYMVKHSGNKDGCRFYDSGLGSVVEKRRRIRERLEKADVEKDFVLHYQPQVDAMTGALTGVEIFPHLTGDMEELSPAELIPVAEDTGLMSKLGVYIARTAMLQVREWIERCGRSLNMTINLSPLQVVDAEYIDSLGKMTEEIGMDPSNVVLDVSNEVIMGTKSTAKETLVTLHERGFKLSVNDFGGGDINLFYVLECGFDGIKLSRSLVSVADDENILRLIRSILAISDTLGMEVTAVGIETRDQMAAMMELGITNQQGFHFGHPMRAKELERYFPRLGG